MTPALTRASGPGFGKRPVVERRDVDDAADSGLPKLLGRDAIEIGMVDDRDVIRAQPLDEVLRPASEPGAPVNLAGATPLTIRVRSASRRTRCRRACARARRAVCASSSRSIRVWVGSPGTFSTRKWASATLAICGRCVIVSTCARVAKSTEDLCDTVRSDAADPGIDLVEDDRLAPGDRGQGKRDPRELAARCGVGDRAERKAGVGTHEEDDLVAAGRPRIPLAHLDGELAVPHPDIAELGRDGVCEAR